MVVSSCPLWVDGELMKRSVMDYVDRVQEEWDTGARTHPEEGLLVFDPKGQMVSASAGPDGWDAPVGKSLLLGIAKVTFVTPATVDWLAVLSSVTSHVALWAQEAHLSGDVVCPHSLEERRRSLFGASWRTRSVTGRQVRDLVEGLPLVSLQGLREKSTEWMHSLSVKVWISNWMRQAARAELRLTNGLLLSSLDRLEVRRRELSRWQEEASKVPEGPSPPPPYAAHQSETDGLYKDKP